MDEERFIGEKLNNLGRAADMLWLSIGNPHTIEITYRDNRKKQREVTEFGIHFQCQWRFVKNGDILLASHDIYNPFDSSLEYDEEWDWDVFGREKEQSSVFDVRSKELISKFFPLKIENIHLIETYDLHIDFDKDVYFDTFITYSTKREYYRLIDFRTNKHTVIFDVDD